MRRWVLACYVWAGVCAGTAAFGQSSSLYGPPGARTPLTLENTSWLYIKLEPPREVQLNDIITVIVDEKSQVISEGEVDRRKRANFEAVLEDWPLLRNGNLKPSPQSDGDPAVSGDLDSRYRAETELETRDGMRFRIAARIVDIRPNGNLVLEGHRMIRNNEEAWMQSLTGVVRREDVLPNNTVISEDIAELQIHKRELGHVRDGYKRGWLLRLWDQFRAF